MSEGTFESVGDPELAAGGTELQVDVEGRTVTLRDETVVQIGRNVPDGIVVSGDSVSRVHAELRRTGPTWTLVDLGSLNGTFIDGERIDQHQINAPVTVHLGRPEAGTSLVIQVVSVPRVEDAADAEVNAAYAETMVARDMGTLDLEDDSQPSGPNLVVQVGTAELAFPHSAAVSVGRLPENDVVIADPACSRIHGYVEPIEDGWMYRNVSSHGTFHRGEPIETLTINVPTVLTLGHPDSGPSLALAHRGMRADEVPEPTDPRRVFQVGRYQISRKFVYGVLVVAVYLAAAALAVAYSPR